VFYVCISIVVFDKFGTYMNVFGMELGQDWNQESAIILGHHMYGFNFDSNR